MIWFLLGLKLILGIELWRRHLRNAAVFFFIHAVSDVVNKSVDTYYVSWICFLIIPHALIMLIANKYKYIPLHVTNFVSFVALIIILFLKDLQLLEMLKYFLCYAFTVLVILNQQFRTEKRVDSIILIGNLLIQIIEVQIFILFEDYVVINIVNSIYYFCIGCYLIWLFFQKNTPIVDDPTENKTKTTTNFESVVEQSVNDNAIRKVA